ncbi:MAG: Dipeptidyl-peptidase 5 [Thermoanaerobaculia bacterium]|nr:Dipeptidyl-peptidase 5 [Thermoanaerobaculia bacterium]
MSIPFRLQVLVASLLFLTSAPIGAVDAPASKRFELDDLARIVRLSSPRISPDGKSIALVVTRADLEKNKWVSELDLVDVATGERRILTRERKGVGHPRWSPSGDRLAFLALDGAEKEAKAQIWVLPMAGGEATKVTNSATGVQHFAWRPDGKAFAYAAEDERPNKAEIERGNDLFEVGNDNLFVTEAPMPVHVWLVPAGGGEARRLTSGPWSLPEVLPPSPPSSPLSWSPDGKLLAFVRVETPHSGDSDRSTVRILDVESGESRALTGKTLLEGFPVFSPDGSKLSYWCPRDRDLNNVNDIHVTSVAEGGEGRNLTKPIDRCLYASVWTPDGKALIVGGNDGTRVSLWLAPLDAPARRLELGDVHPAWSFFVDVSVGPDASLTFVGSEPNRPAELWHMVSASARPRRLTDFGAEIAGRDLGKVEAFTWQGPDGWKEDGVVVLPPGLAPGTKALGPKAPGPKAPGPKAPLVLLIHGGPQAASTRGFSAPAQLFAAQGWVVFSPNYRGSDNLGNAYQRAIFNDAGDGPGRDVLSGVDALVERGFVDPERIAVSGWSYGGYMTAWLIGHDRRWKAAVAGAAVTDLADQYCFADFNVQMRYAMKGMASPFSPEGDALYRAQSPITFARNAKTPTLILTNTGDFRVPHTQSFKLYHALKGAGVETSFVAIPVGGHFPGDPLRAREVYRRWIAWLEPRLK